MIRITGGFLKGRGIATPKSSQTRPTQAKLRQAIFHSLQGTLPGAVVLDLFAGSGALGFEALSWGASRVVFVDRSSAALEVIRHNARTLQVSDQVSILSGSVQSILKKLSHFGPFDLVFADPPYGQGIEKELLDWPWESLLSSEGIFCLEWSPQQSQQAQLPERGRGVEKVREKSYGESVWTTYRALGQETRTESMGANEGGDKSGENFEQGFQQSLLSDSDADSQEGALF